MPLKIHNTPGDILAVKEVCSWNMNKNIFKGDLLNWTHQRQSFTLETMLQNFRPRVRRIRETFQTIFYYFSLGGEKKKPTLLVCLAFALLIYTGKKWELYKLHLNRLSNQTKFYLYVYIRKRIYSSRLGFTTFSLARKKSSQHLCTPEMPLNLSEIMLLIY